MSVKERGPRRPAEPAATAEGGASSARPPEAGDPVAWGSLAILEPLGTSAFGEVFRAHDPALGREVILELRPAAEEESPGEARFLDEARRLSKVHNTHVVTIHGADRREGCIGFWMDRVEGRTLEEDLERDGPLPAGDARRIGLDLCRALAAIHGVGIVHREVRTTRVVREPSGRVVLLESASLGDLERLPDPVSPGTEAGDPAAGELPSPAEAGAMAPEQLTGEGMSPSTDVYGLGALLYRLVSGHDPVETPTIADRIARHRMRQFVPLRNLRPALPLDLVRVIEKAIDPDPMRRFPNAVAFERALSAALSVTMEPSPAAAGRARAPGRRVPPETLDRWRSTVFSGMSLALGLGIAYLLIAEPDRARTAPGALGPPVPAVVPDGPPAQAARPGPASGSGAPGVPSRAAPRPAPVFTPPSASTEEPEEQWVYKPIPRPGAAGSGSRQATPAPESQTPQARAVAGATALLRTLAQGPPAAAEPKVPVDSTAFLVLTTTPPGAEVIVDGIPQHAITNAIYRLRPGTHTVEVQRDGYMPQALAPMEFGPGQRVSAALTLAPVPADSAMTP